MAIFKSSSYSFTLATDLKLFNPKVSHNIKTTFRTWFHTLHLVIGLTSINICVKGWFLIFILYTHCLIFHSFMLLQHTVVVLPVCSECTKWSWFIARPTQWSDAGQFSTGWSPCAETQRPKEHGDIGFKWRQWKLHRRNPPEGMDPQCFGNCTCEGDPNCKLCLEPGAWRPNNFL